MEKTLHQHHPIAVEVLRGHSRLGPVESVHLVDAVIADSQGKIIASYGEGTRGIFPRSSIKLLQALPLVESGAADHFKFNDKHLALACASHNGEAFHTKAALEMLHRANLQPHCLECGAQLPRLQNDVEAMIKAGTPVTALHNNCSGKHAGFLAFATHAGLPLKGYVEFGSPVMKEIAALMETLTGEIHGAENYGIDGCSIPTFKIAMDKLAIAYAKVAAGEGASPLRSRAIQRLRDACMANSQYIAGIGCFDTELMSGMKNRVFTKVGAEGVFTIAIPELALGAVLKCRDGTIRAAQSACAYLVESMLEEAKSNLEEDQVSILKRLQNPTLKNWNKLTVGSLRISSQ